MKKRNFKNLSLTKKTISRFDNNVETIKGGTETMSTAPGCATGNTVSAIILCMEDFTEGCSPSFLNQCPTGKHTYPGYCW